MLMMTTLLHVTTAIFVLKQLKDTFEVEINKFKLCQPLFSFGVIIERKDDSFSLFPKYGQYIFKAFQRV